MTDRTPRPVKKSGSAQSRSRKRSSGAQRTSRTQTPAQRRRQAVITAIGLVLLAAVVITTWVLNNRDSSSTSPSVVGVSASSTTGKTSSAAGTAKKSTAKKTSTARKSTATTKTGTRATSGATAQIPARVTTTLALIDAGEWPEAANAPGTRGGIAFRNSEGLLPRTDASGKRITYQEWDVNPKVAGRSRDAMRIVTGSDGSAWYTADHYASFTQIRGPNS